MKDETVTITATTECPHANGWWDYVSFWIFKKRVFFCTDCERVIDRQRKEAKDEKTTRCD
jgi:hypothetical protein